MTEPAKIFGSMLHGHLAARGVSARQFRNGQEVRIIDQDRGYDFNYQQYKQLQQPVEFLPVSYCDINNRGVYFGVIFLLIGNSQMMLIIHSTVH